MLLGLLGWLDLLSFLWTLLALILAQGARVSRSQRWQGRLAAMVGGTLCASPQLLAALRERMMVRIPSGEEVLQFRTAFRDVFAASSDMQWVFVLAVVGLPLLWKRRPGGHTVVGILAIVSSAYALWLAAAVRFQLGSFSDPQGLFHLLRFSLALAGGAGGFELARRCLELLGSAPPFRDHRLLGDATRRGPMAFLLIFVLLLPDTAAFIWQPLKLDALYYPSLFEWDPSVRRLERWVLDHTRPDEVVLTGDETGEWIASLTGRRVWTGVRVLTREEAIARRRPLHRLFLRGDTESMRKAFQATGASVLVFDPFLREVYWEFDEDLLESSGLFEKQHQIVDRYAIYRFKGDHRPSP